MMNKHLIFPLLDALLSSEYIVTYTPGDRQRPLSKQQYDQPLLDNNSANNSHCYAIPVPITLATIEEKKNSVFWWSLPRYYNWYDTRIMKNSSVYERTTFFKGTERVSLEGVFLRK
jgi:hypothetical protein